MQQERMLSLGSRKTGSLWGATQGYRRPRGFLRIASYLNGYEVPFTLGYEGSETLSRDRPRQGG